MEERWVLGHLETNFGLASLEPLLGEIFWRSWTTVNMQRRYFPKRSDEEDEKIFKKAFMRSIREYFDMHSVKNHVLVADQQNLERCLNLLKERGLEYELMNEER